MKKNIFDHISNIRDSLSALDDLVDEISSLTDPIVDKQREAEDHLIEWISNMVEALLLANGLNPDFAKHISEWIKDYDNGDENIGVQDDGSFCETESVEQMRKFISKIYNDGIKEDGRLGHVAPKIVFNVCKKSKV